ncbi:hypothetical protein H5410_002918 [Solanum commersonii]|uniref:Molybdenum cofactor sulfurase middle domain-containing protein n=1 Tax=Solanum commersonii TaxID=4109 RepID=A0A9J6B3C0_SOLCO|nr:hypothetical protein H5410_002918 [Solanum commersonii]
MADNKEAAQVISITIYPLKSCRGISIPEAALSSTGFRWDRQWIVVNSKGRACTQRVEPSLALVEVELPNDALSEGWEPNPSSFLGPQIEALRKLQNKAIKITKEVISLVSTSPFLIVIRAPGMDVLKVPLAEPSEVANGVSVWEWSGSALDEGDEASKWFSKYLGKPSRLVRFNEGMLLCPLCNPPKSSDNWYLYYIAFNLEML